MKTVFIINPKAGRKKDVDKLTAEILSVSRRLDKEVQVYVTGFTGDAKNFVREYCTLNGAARFIVCGGDGTLNEVVNGVVGFDCAQVGIMPMGTGNDFCRNFSGGYAFSDIEAQIVGDTTKCDLIRYTTDTKSGVNTGYCVNMFNIGFDCNVADMTNKLKDKPLVPKALAYLIAIFCILVKKRGANLAIDIDGKRVFRGPLLLTSIANGSFCGGGIRSNPTARVDDGLMDVNIVNNVSRTTFLGKLPYYMKGTHIGLKGIEKIITAHRCSHMTVTPLDGKMRLCTDGEICDAYKTEFDVMKNAINFVLPKK